MPELHTIKVGDRFRIIGNSYTLPEWVGSEGIVTAVPHPKVASLIEAQMTYLPNDRLLSYSNFLVKGKLVRIDPDSIEILPRLIEQVLLELNIFDKWPHLKREYGQE